MKVYVVLWGHCGDCGQIVGVFRDAARAQAHIDSSLPARLKYEPADDFTVEEWGAV